MSDRTEYAVTFTARGKVELLEFEPDASPLAPHQVAGHTVCSLVSAGTESAGLWVRDNFPVVPGYTSVFEVEAVGDEVEDLKPGDLAFTMQGHRSCCRADREALVRLPDGLEPERACFCRMMNVPSTTLVTTDARPPDTVLVTGLGPVGNMGAQLFRTAGYEVIAADPDAGRRRLAEACGISPVFEAAPVEDDRYAGKVALVLECSGHEAAALAACSIVRKRGEVVLVGVPWVKRTDITAHEILEKVFFNYVVLRSGWEWEIPTHPEAFRPHSVMGYLGSNMRWISEGRIVTEGLYRKVSPRECQKRYEEIHEGTSEKLVTIFDWELLG